jgi:hypothetical protein
MHMVGVAKDFLMCVLDFVIQSVTLSSHPKTSLRKGMKGIHSSNKMRLKSFF